MARQAARIRGTHDLYVVSASKSCLEGVERGRDHLQKKKRLMGGGLPFTANLVPSSATSSPFLFKQDLCFVNVIMLVSREIWVGKEVCGFRDATVGGGVDTGGVCKCCGRAPAALRFFEELAAETALPGVEIPAMRPLTGLKRGRSSV